MKTSVGLDFGRGNIKICIDGKCAKIPARYSLEKPPGQISDKTGLELKSKSFSLLIREKERWFDTDVLGVISYHENDVSQCSPEHISILFRAVLYKWGKQHNINLSTLGKLHITASMPPGDFSNPTINKKVAAAYRNAFNTGQSHPKIADGKNTVQIVTHFDQLVPEAAVWGSSIPRKNELVLVVDIGYFTVDYVWFNGSAMPAKTLTDNQGLLHAYSEIDALNPAQAELKVLRSKTLPEQIKMHYNTIKGRIQSTNSQLPVQPGRIHFIGGGASLATGDIKKDLSGLANKVFFKDEFANVRANWRKAIGK